MAAIRWSMAADAWSARTAAIWVPVTSRGGRMAAAAEIGDPAAASLVRDSLKNIEPSPLPGDPMVVPTWGRVRPEHLVLADIGADVPPPPLRFEQAIAAAARACRTRHLPELTVPLPGWRDAPDEARRAVMAAAVGLRSSRIGESARSGGTPALQLAAAGRAREVRTAASAAARDAGILADVHRLANLDAATATPERIASEARRLARRWGAVCRVYDRRALERMGCRALLAVGSGSRHPPCLIEIKHDGGRRGAAPIVLVGKTITFDSGGLSLKPWKNMSLMRYDKSGGMAVLAAAVLAAARDLPLRVIGLLPVAENMPDGGAVRPGDVLRTRAGVTVEVLSTDAEGRLILADALSVAADRRPRAVVDIATLTGAAVVALGHHAAAVLGNDEGLIARLREVGDDVGERLWPLPLWSEYGRQLRSEFADLANSGEGGAGTILGAAFLQRFAPPGVPWAHLDIAGTAYLDAPVSHREPGATVFGARLLADWLARGAPLR